MRFVLDEDLSPRIASISQEFGIDVHHVRYFNRGAYTDHQQLVLAGQDGRCIVTRNGPDFWSLSVQFEQLRLPHAGVLIVSRSLDRRNFAGIARAIAAYANDHPGDMPPYMVDYLHRPAAGV